MQCLNTSWILFYIACRIDNLAVGEISKAYIYEYIAFSITMRRMLQISKVLFVRRYMVPVVGVGRIRILPKCFQCHLFQTYIMLGPILHLTDTQLEAQINRPDTWCHQLIQACTRITLIAFINWKADLAREFESHLKTSLCFTVGSSKY